MGNFVALVLLVQCLMIFSIMDGLCAEKPRDLCLDLVFAVDNPATISEVQREAIHKLIHDILSRVDIGSKKGKVGLVTFGKKADLEFGINKFKTRHNLLTSIMSITTQKIQPEKPKPGLALWEVLQMTRQNSKLLKDKVIDEHSGKKRGRVLVIITSYAGISSSNLVRTIKQVYKLKNDGIIPLFVQLDKKPPGVDRFKSFETIFEGDTFFETNVSSAALSVTDALDDFKCGCQGTSDVCLTKECILVAATLIKNMDETVNPCDDFYNYACGSFMKETVIPEGESWYGPVKALRQEVAVKLRASLMEDVGPDDIESTIKSKDLYASCFNESEIEKRGMTPLRDYINSLGGWPILGNVSWSTWNENEFDWQSLVAQTGRLNIFALISTYVADDPKNSSVFILTLNDALQLGMAGGESREYLIEGRNSTFVKGYEEWMVSFVMLMKEADDKITEAQVRQDVGDVIDFDIEIAKITTPKEARRDREKFYNKWTVDFLQNNITGVDWLRYLNELFEGVNITITNDLEINVAVPQYIRNLIELINNTPEHVVANYLLWIAVTDAGGLDIAVGSDFREIRHTYNEVIFGSTLEKPRWKTCTTYVANHLMTLPSAWLYLKNNFDRESKKVALDMVNQLNSSFVEMVKEQDWMTDAVKTAALEKLEAMRFIIGFEDSIQEADKINKEFEKLKINRQLMFENVVASMYFLANENFGKIGKLVTDENSDVSKSMPPHTVNAGYFPTRNMMVFPAAYLQPNNFHKDYPKSLNYGAIGETIGHEMTHGFDDQGRLYDKDGNLFQWWPDDVIKEFKDRAQCFVNQYGNFTIPEININVNGINTQGENIADNGGLKQALMAYRSWAKKQDGREKGLPGLALSNEQLFFLSFAQTMCEIEKPESLINLVKTLPYPPGRFRVIGSIQNCPDFSEVFNCNKGDKMNPISRCRLW